MNSRFESFESSSVFKRSISDLYKSPLIRLRKDSPEDAQDIAFVLNQVAASRRYSRYKGRKPISLQRQLFDTALFKLKALFFLNDRIIDVAGGGYQNFFNLSKENYDILNVRPSADTTFVADAESECKSIPCMHYNIALCLNYLLLAKDPERVVRNVWRFLKSDGTAIFDFISLSYWYLGNDGLHWQSYNPRSISRLITPYFSDYVIIPIGNWFQGACNYYAKQDTSRILRHLLIIAGKCLGGFDRSPASAIHYLVVARKANHFESTQKGF